MDTHVSWILIGAGVTCVPIELAITPRVKLLFVYLGAVLIGLGCVGLGVTPRETVWNGTSSQSSQTWTASLGMLIAGAAFAHGGWRLARFAESRPFPTFGGGIAKTIVGLIGLAGYGLMLFGVACCGLACYLPSLLH